MHVPAFAASAKSDSGAQVFEAAVAVAHCTTCLWLHCLLSPAIVSDDEHLSMLLRAFTTAHKQLTDVVYREVIAKDMHEYKGAALQVFSTTSTTFTQYILL
jgi:hypothetical protein